MGGWPQSSLCEHTPEELIIKRKYTSLTQFTQLYTSIKTLYVGYKLQDYIDVSELNY